MNEQDSKTKFSYAKRAVFLPQWKKEFEWLKNVTVKFLQRSLKDVEKAYRCFLAIELIFLTSKMGKIVFGIRKVDLNFADNETIKQFG
ncbi:hypothetical protein [Providencia alcalifaciens]|uniref:Transposase n=1 Tax=Providencia alcalifaciens 205/92 TaxID=1256988 RepID=A0AAV3M7N0_9GAMM|nr:hypothetical protein [Providencia alcalifaciens]EUD04581.1 hypothetical protein HMPREF1565_0983 [Providencia alcalifaciens RIMD 1656011]EUD11741.1 hypothetical protein HMPREF1563_0351 [Providencia alcalifaciens 205/92]MTC29250.1 hypothetical protein [Providencia alcalifaciens]MTC62413.1 hypothetical protein [Providencia alcalifaciens]WGZ56310.1 hypothetical protein PO864_20135 [Providencia alcalifaciens]